MNKFFRLKKSYQFINILQFFHSLHTFSGISHLTVCEPLELGVFTRLRQYCGLKHFRIPKYPENTPFKFPSNFFSLPSNFLLTFSLLFCQIGGFSQGFRLQNTHSVWQNENKNQLATVTLFRIKIKIISLLQKNDIIILCKKMDARLQHSFSR